ncbi:unnamed protein product [Spirodela intermedia]|uniref:DYW domain-containing protein n=1 Tax=Spirodela intermedia TaxID=51605 RepID=A0A7I8IKG7_SPIIN|nr:unnamed protein product [Spirodela intermedia]CAA6657882.1 unnamed protein product [Spirodela intermedia]
MIRLHAESDSPGPAPLLLPRMLEAGLWPDTHTYPFLLKACAKLLYDRDGEVVHGRAVHDGLAGSVFVQNSLLHLYAACGLFEHAHQLFEEMPVRNLALTLYRDMMAPRPPSTEEQPDGFTMVSLLSACAELGTLVLGRRIHVYLWKVGLDRNSHVGNALIDLYAKSGTIGDARKVFDEMAHTRSAVSWTSLIVGLAVNGFGKEALGLFGDMGRAGLSPIEITFVGVMYACIHCGLVDDGFRYFDRMRMDYGIAPKIEHFGCMVDLLGRAGLVDRAYSFILGMPMEPNAVCRTDIGEAGWARLEQLDPGHSGDFVLLSNLYASDRRWADVHRIRRSLVKGGVKKTPGHTVVELGNNVHEFVMGDRSHPESDAIYGFLEEIAVRLRREGYAARATDVLADIEEEKETALSHSERLALRAAQDHPETTIRIVKNLRVCEDCHLAIKLMSKVYDQEVVVRDRSRFHHFKGGFCSCKDYW